MGPDDSNGNGDWDEAWSSVSYGFERGDSCEGSSATVRKGGDSFVSPYYSSEASDASNPSDTEGYADYSDITDWVNFDNMTRGWTFAWSRLVDSYAPYLCGPGTGHTITDCAIVDLSLPASGSSRVRNTTGDGATQNDAFVSGSACPAEAGGNETITTWQGCSDAAYTNQATCEAAAKTWYPAVTALKNAFEVLMDGVGDDDGYCESSEACLYAPNFGAYQGHGTPGTCTFSNGTITGVTLYGHPENGR